MADNQQYWPLQPKQISASDIRKVIANGTKANGAWNTIATADELKKKEVDKANQKTVKIPTSNSSTTAKKTTTKVETPTPSKTAVKEAPQWPVASPVVSASQLTSDVFKNPQLQPINNIPVSQQENEATPNNVASNNNIKNDMFINNTTVFPELKNPIDVDNPLMDLFSDVKKKVEKWTLAAWDIQKLKQLPRYAALSNMKDDELLKLIGTMWSMVQAWLPLNDTNLKKLKSKFPSLSSAEWWFDVGQWENMYQAWWLKEQMSATAPTDLNKYGTAWAIVEWAVNPLGELITIWDMAAQQIPQIDSNNQREKMLRAELTKIVSNEDLLNQYKDQYKKFVESNPLSKLYTTRVEWDNIVEQVWNALNLYWLAKWKTHQDIDAWFKDWLVKTVNNKVNGWYWEFMWVWEDLTSSKKAKWPNVAKELGNAPASAIKTATAITRAITNPIDTASWLVVLTTDAWNNYQNWTFDKSIIWQRYGSWEAWQKAIEQDPIWVASDLLALVETWWAIAKVAAWTAAKWTLAAALSTETLWAARSTENLLKLASRLEYLSKEAAGVERTAWLASNLWVDIPIRWWNVMIGWKNIVTDWLVWALKKWGDSGDSLLQKAASYTAKRAETWVGKIAKDALEVAKEWPINTIANKLMGTASDTDKLMKAASPNLNTLRNNVDYKNKRANMDIATQAIVDAWFSPKNISEWAKAHTETLNQKWNEFKQMVKDKWDVIVDVKDILEDVKNYIKSEREWATEVQKQDLRKLEVEVNALERQWKLSMEQIEKKKEHYNSSWRDADKLKVGDVYLRWLKMIGNAMRKQQDNILGKWPEQTKKLRKEIWALMDTKNDVLKADLRNQKKKSDISWGGLVESYWRLSWLWDVIGWVASWILGKWWEWFAQAWKWVGKMVLWKAMWRAKDVDYLTKKWFEGLAKKKWVEKVGWLRNKLQSLNKLKDLIAEKEELKKQLKEGKITQKEYDYKVHETDDKHAGLDYQIAQARSRITLWDKEGKMTAESKKKVLDYVSKRAKDVDFVTKVAESMEEDKKGSWTDVQKKLIQYEKDPTNTTYQHELFHAFFSVVDEKTKTYILDEAKKILKMEWLRDVNAEEWLAESFGIYAKRKQIKLWLIDAPKGFIAKVRDFFQRVYEYMQRFNGDRATINKLFDEVLWDRQMKNWIMDLSDLLWNKEVKSRKLYSEMWDNSLKRKSVYHGSPADFDKFDSSHMWEWEGAQAHGWGHYVAVNEQTWRNYASMWHRKYEYDGKDSKWYNDNLVYTPFTQRDAKLVAENMVLWDYATVNKTDWIIDHLKEEVQATIDNPYTDNAIRDKYKEVLKELDNIDVDKLKQKPWQHLYNLDIPDPVKKDTPTGSNYIEEKDIVPEEVKDTFMKKLEEYWLSKAQKDRIRENLWYFNNSSYWTLYKRLSRILWGDKAASKFLESLWYDWIHYFWWRDWEAYVIFNDDALKIKEHIRYKKKIWDKEVEINKDITSPNKMVKINDKGYSVIKQFISEKQAEKALDVSKELLDDKWNPYMWTHTNKYNSEQFANFINTKDSKYKEFTDNEIAWFTNNEDMSRSYWNWDSILANTKPYKSVAEFNKQNTKVEKNSWEQTTRTWIKIPTETENTIWTKIIEKDWKYNVVQVNEGKFILDTTLDKLLDDMDIAKEWYMPDNETKHTLSRDERIERVKWEFAWSYSWWKWNVDIKELPNWKVEVTRDWSKTLWSYDSEKAALAEYTASKTGKSKYHYQWIIQNIKNPLVVDIKWEWDNLSFWNKLWNAYDFLKRSDEKWLKRIEKVQEKFDDSIWKYVEKRKELDNAARDLKTEYYNRIKDDRLNNPNLTDEERNIIREENIWKGEEFSKALSVQYGINQMLFWYENDLKPNQIDFVNTHKDFKKIYDDAKTFLETNKEMRNIVERPTEKDLMNWAKKNWLDDATAWLFHWMWIRGMDWFNFITELKRKELQTNDYVFYALNKWGYDWVLFKWITDYWHEPKWWWGMAEAWDVIAAFKSNDFKAWDNSNPTDSKYISYKKKVKLDKKSEWLQKKNSSWLLAKGRERMGDGGIRYKAAWHGSPTQFDRFDSSHMSEWEWNQAHWWGHYVAVDRKTAEKYASMQKLKNMKLDGKNIEAWIDEYEKKWWDAISLTNPKLYARARVSKNLMMWDWLATAKSMAKDRAERYLESIKWTEKEVDWKKYIQSPSWLYPKDAWEKTVKLYENQIKAIDEITPEMYNDWVKGNRNLYELDIPDPVKRDTPTGSNYIEEDAEIKKPQYMKIINEAKKRWLLDTKNWSHLDYYIDYATAWHWDKMTWYSLYRALEDMIWDGEKTSKFLESLGYDWIHYFWGQDWESYVLFNDESPKIKNALRYKKAYHWGWEFDKFDLSHAGEGEWNTAHWYWIYVTENKARAKEYWSLYRNNRYWLGLWWGNWQFVTYKGKRLPEINWENSSLIWQIIEWMQNMNDANPYYSAESQIARAKHWLLSQQMVWQWRWLADKATKEAFEKKMKFLDWLNPKDFKIENPKRNLYEVEVPDMKKANTPTWTNYIEESGLITNEAYKAINDKLFKETGNKMTRWSSKVDGKTVYDRLSEVLGSKKQASEFLKDMWYDWIHYIGKEDWSSYVLFNDKTPQIKNSIRYKKWLQKKADWLEKKDSWMRYKVSWVIEREWDNPSHNAVRNAVNRMAETAKELWFTIKKHSKQYLPEEALEYLSEINRQIVKENDPSNSRKINISEADKQKLYWYKNAIIKELLEGIKKWKIDWSYNWYIHRYFDQRENRVKSVPTVKFNIWNTEKWYHSPVFIWLAPKRITKLSPRWIIVEG